MHQANFRTYLGVFLIASSLLMLEVSLTRIFSLVLFYPFAVMSISLALFGSATAGVMLYFFPSLFNKWKLENMLSFLSLIYSISVIVTFVIFLQIPLAYLDISSGKIASWTLVLAYVDLALPFFFGGLCLSLVLTTFASQISRLYSADLIGAALGCLLTLCFLNLLGGSGTILAVAVVGAVASLVFCFSCQTRIYYGHLVWLGTSIAILILHIQFNICGIKFVKGNFEPTVLYERWNSFSRVAVYPEHKEPEDVFGWGLSRKYAYNNPGWMRLTIDGMASTPITRFNGDWKSVLFLKYDVTSLVYYLRSNAKVLVIGPGGGRDVLSALMFGAHQVDGVELNPLIVQAVRHNFADFAGHIYDDPRVHIYIDDGRNFLAKSSEHYDVLQASGVDTWAVTAAGAFALSENTLYTREAFQMYRQHLTPNGILSFSRIIYPGDRYGEALRLISLALATWKEDGMQEPGRYLMLVGNLNASEDAGWVSLLLKNSPFTIQEVKKIEVISKEMGFSILYAPFDRGHGVVYELVTAQDYESFWKNYSIDITPPTDDRPFFFQMLKMTDIPRLGLMTIFKNYEELRFGPIATLGILLMLVSFLVCVFILGPMWTATWHASKKIKGNTLYLVYYACLGTGYMLIEVGLIQKFVLFLGHPTYSLAVVLSSFLLSSGIGSFATRLITTEHASRVASRLGVGLILLLPFYIILLTYFQSNYMGLNQLQKIIVSISVLFPIGFLMGTFFPLGIKHTTLHQARSAIPWYWAVNCATSIFASVFAIALGLQLGIRAVLIGGWLNYLIATGILFIFVQKQRQVRA